MIIDKGMVIYGIYFAIKHKNDGEVCFYSYLCAQLVMLKTR